MRVRFLPLLLLLAIACASKPSPFRPAVDVEQRGELFFGSNNTSPLSIEVLITNTASAPIEVRRVRVQSGQAMVQYGIYAQERFVREVIPAGETRTVRIATTAYTERSRLVATEPLTLRLMIDFRISGKQYLEVYHGLTLNQ